MKTEASFMLLDSGKARCAILSSQIERIENVVGDLRAVEIDRLLGLETDDAGEAAKGSAASLFGLGIAAPVRTAAALDLVGDGLLPLRLPTLLRRVCAPWVVGVLCHAGDASAPGAVGLTIVAIWIDLPTLVTAVRSMGEASQSTAAHGPSRSGP